MNELVSIIMPSYNTGNYIVDSIQSVINQTYSNWELIIVDDCSTDNTEEIVFSFKDNRIRFYKNEENRGAAFSRNKALMLTKGKWIAFLDSDDLWAPEKLEKQISFMVKGNYSFSYTAYEEIDEKSQLIGVQIFGPSLITKKRMFRYCWPGCLTVMYDKEMIGSIQIFDIAKNNDYAIWLKICKKTNCFFLNEVLAQYRRGRKGSVSSHSFIKMIKWHYSLFRLAEQENVFLSVWHTYWNLFWGVWKKIKYVKRIR